MLPIKAVELFTVVLRQLLALVTVPLVLLIAYSQVFGDRSPTWSAFLLLGLIIVWLALWLRGTIRLLRLRRSTRAA